MFLGFSFLLSGLRRISTLISGTATDVSDDDGISPVFCNQTFFVTKFLFLYSLISSFHLFFLLYHHIFSYFISSLIRRYVSYVNSESGILRQRFRRREAGDDQKHRIYNRKPSTSNSRLICRRADICDVIFTCGTRNFFKNRLLVRGCSSVSSRFCRFHFPILISMLERVVQRSS